MSQVVKLTPGKEAITISKWNSNADDSDKMMIRNERREKRPRFLHLYNHDSRQTVRHELVDPCGLPFRPWRSNPMLPKQELVCKHITPTQVKWLQEISLARTCARIGGSSNFLWFMILIFLFWVLPYCHWKFSKLITSRCFRLLCCLVSTLQRNHGILVKLFKKVAI